VTQPDLEARLAYQTIDVAREREQWDEAFRRADAAIAGYEARGLRMREGPGGDAAQLAAVGARRGCRPRSDHCGREALAAGRRGEPRCAAPGPDGSGRRLDTLRIATTDSAGRFRMDDAAPAGVVATELADRRSKPAVIADHVPLVLEPTRRVSGRIDLTGIPPGGVEVVCVPVQAVTDRFVLLAPIGSDGTFSIDGASVGAVRIGVSIQTGWAGERLELDTLPASPTSITGLQLTFATSNREMDIVVRSAVDTPLDGVLVILMSGKHPIDRLKNVRDLDRRSISDLRSERDGITIGATRH
jgi:hypothetical protein